MSLSCDSRCEKTVCVLNLCQLYNCYSFFMHAQYEPYFIMYVRSPCIINVCIGQGQGRRLQGELQAPARVRVGAGLQHPPPRGSHDRRDVEAPDGERDHHFEHPALGIHGGLGGEDAVPVPVGTVETFVREEGVVLGAERADLEDVAIPAVEVGVERQFLCLSV